MYLAALWGEVRNAQKTRLCVWNTWRGDMGAQDRINLQRNLRK